MKTGILSFICVFATLTCFAQTFSSIVPDSVYARFFLFDKEKNVVGVYCGDADNYGGVEIMIDSTIEIFGMYKEGITRLQKLLSQDDYDFFQQQLKACKVNDYKGYYRKSNYSFVNKRTGIQFKKVKKIEVTVWYNLPLFNLEKNLALVYKEGIGQGFYQVYALHNGKWQLEINLGGWIE